jgi:DNA-directed RNA polymerase subunit omega
MRPVFHLLGRCILKVELIEQAKARVPSVHVLVNMVSKRVRELNRGERPLVKPEADDENTDIAMREIGEGKLIAEVDFSGTPDADS